MIDHLSTYATDYLATKSFYKAVFEPLGYSIQVEFTAEWNKNFPTQRMCAFGEKGQTTFWIIESTDAYTPRHIAFTAKCRSDVDRFYEVAIESGGECNGEPGLRPMYHEHYYGAFVFDPDGNNVEAVCHLPE